MRTLRMKSKGDAVVELTSILCEMNLLRNVKEVFDNEVRSAVKAFQHFNLDSMGSPLVADGIVGGKTWWALKTKDQSQAFFNGVPLRFYSVPENSGSELGRSTLQVAINEMGEEAGEEGANNSGPFVAKYLRIPLKEANRRRYSWCAAFVSWCTLQASEVTGIQMPFKYTGGARDIYKQLKRAGKALDKDETPQAGDVVCWTRDGGAAWHGHVGLVYAVEGGLLYTIEGNRGRFPSKVRVYCYSMETMKNLIGFARL